MLIAIARVLDVNRTGAIIVGDSLNRPIVDSVGDSLNRPIG